jgi:hypothetical protein
MYKSSLRSRSVVLPVTIGLAAGWIFEKRPPWNCCPIKKQKMKKQQKDD